MKEKSKQINNRILIYIKDITKMLFLSLFFGIAIFILLFLFGFFLTGAYQNGLEFSKNGLFFIASILLFLLAGMFITKGKKQEQPFNSPKWKHHFQIIGLKTSLFLLCFSFITIAAILDYYLLQIN